MHFVETYIAKLLYKLFLLHFIFTPNYFYCIWYEKLIFYYALFTLENVWEFVLPNAEAL